MQQALDRPIGSTGPGRQDVDSYPATVTNAKRVVGYAAQGIQAYRLSIGCEGSDVVILGTARSWSVDEVGAIECGSTYDEKDAPVAALAHGQFCVA